MLGDCAHLGRQTENENNPLTPEFLCNHSGWFVAGFPTWRVRVRVKILKSSLTKFAAFTNLDAATLRLLASRTDDFPTEVDCLC
jgi:hypothetical protein